MHLKTKSHLLIFLLSGLIGYSGVSTLPAISADAKQEQKIIIESIKERLNKRQIKEEKSISPKNITLDLVLMETLLRNPQIEISKLGIQQSKAVHQQSRSIFDPIIQATAVSSKEYNPYPSAIRTVAGVSRSIGLSTQYSLALSQLYASGFQFTPSISVSKTDTEEDATAPYYSGTVNFSFKMPIMQGRGHKAVTALEKAAFAQIESSKRTMLHTVSEKLYSSTVSYWNYLAAEKQLNLARETEKRAERLVNESQRLIEAGERPASEINQLEAFLSDKRSTRANAEQGFEEARQAAAIAMGKVSLSDMEKLPLPADSFPVPVKKIKKIDFMNKKEALIKIALEMRQDLQQLYKQLDSSNFSLDSAEDNLRPDLDFTMDLGYKALEQGNHKKFYIDALKDGVSGINAQASLNYSWATYNNYDRGTITNAKATVDIINLNIFDKKRQIRSNVSLALSNLNTSIEVLKKAEETIKAYKLALDNERKKARLGMATVLDIMNTQDRYTNSLLVLINARLSYASAIARLRFVTGTVFKSASDSENINFNNMASFPEVFTK